MDLDLIERLIDLVAFSRVTELDFASGTLRVRIERRDTASPEPGTVVATPGTVKTPVPDAAHRIAAGMAGTFFRASGPGHAPFVSEGDTVQEGQTLAILEAMKMLNPVESDTGGRVLQILVENGMSVTAGTPLFVIAPTATV